MAVIPSLQYDLGPNECSYVASGNDTSVDMVTARNIDHGSRALPST